MVRRPQRDRLVADLLGSLVRELDGQVDLTALQRRRAGLVLEDLPLDRVDRRSAAPVGRVRLEGVPGRAAVLLQLERAGAVHLATSTRPASRGRTAACSVLGRMIAWYVCWLSAYGKNPFGAARLNWTPVRADLLHADDHALVGRERLRVLRQEPLERRDDVVGASAACPSWNLTFLRIWNVHVFALFDAFHDVASRGTRREFLSAKTSCSPAMCETASAPSDCSSGGSSEPSVRGEPTRRVPPVRWTALRRCRRERHAGDEAEERDRHPEHRAALQQLAPGDGAVPVLVDQLVLELARALAVGVELLAGITHRSSSSSAPLLVALTVAWRYRAEDASDHAGGEGASAAGHIAPRGRVDRTSLWGAALLSADVPMGIDVNGRRLSVRVAWPLRRVPSAVLISPAAITH